MDEGEKLYDWRNDCESTDRMNTWKLEDDNDELEDDDDFYDTNDTPI